MRDKPGAEDLIATARAALAGLDALDTDRRRYVELMAANAEAIAERQAKAGDAGEDALRRRLADLLGRDGDLATLERVLAAAIRSGRLDDSPALFGLLWRATVERVRESNPKFLDRAGIDAED